LGRGNRRDLHVLAEIAQGPDQATNREEIKATAQQGRNFRLIHAEKRGRANLRQAAFANNGFEARDQVGFDNEIVGIRQVERVKDGAGGVADLQLFVLSARHLRYSCSACFKRILIRSMSVFGVALPDFAFFAKTCNTYTTSRKRTVYTAR